MKTKKIQILKEVVRDVLIVLGLAMVVVAPTHGYRAAFIILKNYIKKHGWVTIEQIVSHWAPKNENDTAVYIFAVCNFMDVKKDHVMDFGNMPDMLMLASAMTVVENGSYYNPQKLYYDLWRPMYEGYKMAFGSRKNLSALEYSPDLHHEIHDVEFQELLAQRVADKDDCLTRA